MKTYLAKLLRNWYWSRHRMLFIPFCMDKGIDSFSKLYGKIQSETEMLHTKAEAIMIWHCIKQGSKVEGHYAELGVYKGGLSKLIACLKPSEKELHLFDTWEGLPYCSRDVGSFSGRNLKKGDFKADFAKVKEYLNEYRNVFFHKGVFPKTADSVKGKLFSLVVVDFDLERPTMEAFRFFYPRMSRGGFFVIHNYKDIDEVGRATDEFFKNKPEVVLPVNGSQAIVQKLEAVGK